MNTYDSDLKLWSDIKEGKEKAFKVFFNDTQHRLRTILYNRVKNWDATYDISTEAYVKVFARIDKYESYPHMRRSLYIIAGRLLVDIFRAKKKTEDIKAHLDWSSEERDIADAMLKGDMIELIMKYVDNLPPKRKKILLLYFREDKHTDEIASIMGCSTQTALNHKTRGIDHLKRLCLSKLLALIPQ